MPLSALKHVTAAWNLDAAGYNSADARFTDQTGNERHIVVKSGAPTFETLGGRNTLSNQDSPGFLACVRNPIMLAGSFVAAFYSITDVVDGVRYFWTMDSFDYPNGAHGVGDPDFTSGGSPVRYFGIYNDRADAGYINGSTASKTFAKSAWHIVATGLDRLDGKMRVSIDGGAWVTGPTPAQRYFWQAAEEYMGLGRFGNGPTLASGNKAGIARRTFIRDRIWVNQTDALAAYVAELKAEFGVG